MTEIKEPILNIKNLKEIIIITCHEEINKQTIEAYMAKKKNIIDGREYKYSHMEFRQKNNMYIYREIKR